MPSEPSIPIRQYFLGPSDAIAEPPNLRIGTHSLWLGEGISAAVAGDASRSIALIGDAIDTDAPHRTASDIAQTLLEMPSIEALWNASRALCGRWTIILHSEVRGLELFTDAAGLLPLFYTAAAEFCVSSSPRFMADRLGFAVTAEAKQFMARPQHILPPRGGDAAFRSGDCWWPLGTTAYAEMRHLLPNHLLLGTSEVARLWPSRSRQSLSVEAAAEQVAQRLKAAFVGIATRYDELRLPVTAGLDSRVLLAAAHSAGVSFRCYTYAPADAAAPRQDQRTDVAVARQLAAMLGRPHDVIDLPAAASDQTIEAMTRNVDTCLASATLPREHEALSRYAKGCADIVCINGNLSEIGRGYYGHLPRRAIRAARLAVLTKMHDSPLATRAYAAWLDDIRQPGETGHNLLDLLYWEDRMGSWQSTVQQQLDDVWAIITPYNCHALLEAMLAAPAAARGKDKLHYEVIRILVPELLRFPVNPPHGGRIRIALKWMKSRLKWLARRNAYANLAWLILRNKFLRP